MPISRDSSLRARAREHIRERGIWYPVGEAIVLVITLPEIYGEAGWSLVFFLSALTVIGIGVLCALFIFATFMVASRPPQNRNRRKH